MSEHEQLTEAYWRTHRCPHCGSPGLFVHRSGRWLHCDACDTAWNPEEPTKGVEVGRRWAPLVEHGPPQVQEATRGGSVADTDLIARCKERAESFGSVPQRTLYDGERKYAEDVPALITALTAAQAEIERLREAMSWLNECEVCKQAFWKEDGWPEADGVPMRTWVMCGGCANQRHFENQAEIERLRGHDSKCESFFVEGAYAYTPCSCAERLALAERDRLREKVKQGDALAAALREIAYASGIQPIMDAINESAATLAAWEDTP